MQSTTMISKSALLSAKARFEFDDTNVLGLTVMDAAKIYRAQAVKSPKQGAHVKEEDEQSTTASSGCEDGGAYTTSSDDNGVQSRRFSGGSGNNNKTDNWFMAQIWGLVAGILLAFGLELLACAAAAMAVFLCCSRKEPFVPCRAPQAAVPVKKMRTQQVKKAPSQRNFAAPQQQKTIIAPKPPARSVYLGGSPTSQPAHLSAAYTQPQRSTAAHAGPRITSAPNPTNVCGSTAELQKLMATPSIPQRKSSAEHLPARRVEPQAQRVAPKIAPPAVPVIYTPAGFRRELVSILKELAQHRNAAVAVGQVRSQNVPVAQQSAEFADILTRAMEERNGPVRRTYVAFAAGLAAGGEGSAFDVQECAKGTGVFFAEVYEELCSEVSRLDKIVECELVPTLRAVFSAEVMRTVLPAAMQ